MFAKKISSKKSRISMGDIVRAKILDNKFSDEVKVVA